MHSMQPKICPTKFLQEHDNNAELIWPHRIRAGNRDSRPTHCSLGPQESPLQAGPRPVQPFLHSEATCSRVTGMLADAGIIDRSSSHLITNSRRPNNAADVRTHSDDGGFEILVILFATDDRLSRPYARQTLAATAQRQLTTETDVGPRRTPVVRS